MSIRFHGIGDWASGFMVIIDVIEEVSCYLLQAQNHILCTLLLWFIILDLVLQ